MGRDISEVVNREGVINKRYDISVGHKTNYATYFDLYDKKSYLPNGEKYLHDNLVKNNPNAHIKKKDNNTYYLTVNKQK